MDRIFDKIKGCLLGAAIGDAMGSPPETRPVYLVRQDYAAGGWIEDYLTPLPDSIAKGFRAGQVTDDFSCAYVAAKHFLKNGGVITRQSAIDGLIDWKNGADTKQFFDRFGGPSTRKGIAVLEGKEAPTDSDVLKCSTNSASNGAGMKGWIVGLFDPWDVDRAIDDAITMCIITHNNPLALAGGTAVAAAVSAGMNPKATLDDVLEAGLYGAREGYRRAWKVAKPTSGPNMERRIEFAIELGLKYGHDFEKCVVEMTDLVGTGLAAAESVAAAFGYVAAGGDAMRSIRMAVNSGNDSDTTAVMTGAMAGVLSGAGVFDGSHQQILERENPFIDFDKMTRELLETAVR